MGADKEKRSRRNTMLDYTSFPPWILILTLVMCSPCLGGVESEFREAHVRLTFREAVQLFEHRSHFIRRSSNACLVRQR